MAKYDVYRDPAGTGFLLDIQSDLVSHLNTRLIAPLLEDANTPRPFKRLHPVFEIKGKAHIMATHLMAAVPKTELSQPVANLADHATQITDAIDFLLHGY